MTTVLDMIKRFQTFDVMTNAEVVIEENKVPILDTQRFQWYEQSLDSAGEPLRSPYSMRVYHMNTKPYRELKEELRGKEITDLFLSGQFYQSLVLDVGLGEYHIYSTDDKAPYIAQWAKAPIFGLTIENQKECYIQFLRPSMLAKLVAHTGVTIGQ